jgi:aromatic-L-amino-acid/L-tryptophan decarboxylase
MRRQTGKQNLHAPGVLGEGIRSLVGNQKNFGESAAQDKPGEGLDPEHWEAFRGQAHAALDDAIDLLQNIRESPVWQPVPAAVRESLAEGLPREGIGLKRTYREFQETILPFIGGNIHPRFWGWVQGSGTPTGIIAEMLAAAMNANCGGRDHGALYVERGVIGWCKEMFGFPAEASGLLVSGTSMANLIALTVARNAKAAGNVRKAGIGSAAGQLTAYSSVEVHACAAGALEILGLGQDSLRRVAVDDRFRIDIAALKESIAADRRAGLTPFCIIGTAGTVNTGAVDDLNALADLALAENVWFHVDGAFGALGVLSEAIKPLLKGIERAHSIGFDFHKWMHVPYDAGCVLVRDGELHRQTFTNRPAYLQHFDRGLAGGGIWPCEYGPELSRGFRALKVWFTLKDFGSLRIGEAITENCRQARYLAALVRGSSELEILAEPILNIVCFRFTGRRPDGLDLDALNREIVADLQEAGIAAPSTAAIRGRVAIRVSITNHRSRDGDFRLLIEEVLRLGRLRATAVGG